MAALDRLGDRLFLGNLPPKSQPSPALAEGFEDAKPEIVDEMYEGQAELFEQKVETEEIEDRDRPHHIDDRALFRCLFDAAPIVRIDLDMRKKAPVDPGEEPARPMRPARDRFIFNFAFSHFRRSESKKTSNPERVPPFPIANSC